MRNFDEWMIEYSKDHQNYKNQIIHKIFVPIIVFSIIGLLWSIPTPYFFNFIPYLNWATFFLVPCLFFYLSLSRIMFFGMTFFSLISIWICFKLELLNIIFPVSGSLFIISWIAQFYGHKIEGHKPSFVKDITFLLIGPLWVLKFFYKKIGITV